MFLSALFMVGYVSTIGLKLLYSNHHCEIYQAKKVTRTVGNDGPHGDMDELRVELGDLSDLF